MKVISTVLFLCLLALTVQAQQVTDPKIEELERKLDQARRQIGQLSDLIESLRAEVSRLKGGAIMDRHPGDPTAEATAERVSVQESSASVDLARDGFLQRIIEPGLGQSAREETLQARPEIFIQGRYSALPIKNAGEEFEPNISLTRIETRWAGKVAERLGGGLEIQFHPAIDGSPEELVNDAFVEYYLSEHATIRAGQFVKPFGFDIQQSSSVRESPERAIFAGYFFPGQRDRGVMFFGDLGFIRNRAFKGIHYFVGAFNGNRFFTDNNRQMNFVARVRELFDRPNLAIGVSLQRGKQLLPPGLTGDNDENLAGVDLQIAFGRFGLRTEFVAGNTPATLLGIETEFAPAFRPGARSAGSHVFVTYGLKEKDNIYARYDQFNRDPVKGYNVRAFNLGYFRQLNEFARMSFDYQFKNRPSFNDDAVNGRLNISWAIKF